MGFSKAGAAQARAQTEEPSSACLVLPVLMSNQQSVVSKQRSGLSADFADYTDRKSLSKVSQQTAISGALHNCRATAPARVERTAPSLATPSSPGSWYLASLAS